MLLDIYIYIYIYLYIYIYWNILTMHVPMNVKSPKNISKWQMGFNLAFKGLKNAFRVVFWDHGILCLKPVPPGSVQTLYSDTPGAFFVPKCVCVSNTPDFESAEHTPATQPRAFTQHNTSTLYTFIKKQSRRCISVSEFIIPCLYKVQHVSGYTPPIIRSSKLY
jgi:hypothetical protein